MARAAPRNVTDLVRIDRDSPRAGCWRIVLDDAAHANALSPTLVASLAHSLREAIAHDARAIVFDSSGDRFCAGFDLRDAEDAADAELRERFEAVETLLEKMRRAPLLTIAIVRGAALGAGADLATACDYRIGTQGARFAFPGSRFGVVLGTRHLAAVVGRQTALEILVEGKTLDADAALAGGLLSEIREPHSIAARVDEILLRSESVDVETLRAMLRLLRDVPSERDRGELLASLSRTGFAERVRHHARRVRDERERRRAEKA